VCCNPLIDGSEFPHASSTNGSFSILLSSTLFNPRPYTSFLAPNPEFPSFNLFFFLAGRSSLSSSFDEIEESEESSDS
jgi:hypothetical protein